MKTRLISLLTLALMAISAMATDYVVVTGTNVRLRLAPSLNSETLTNNKGVNIHPNKGQKLVCLGTSGDFYKVKFNGNNVWISKLYAQPVGNTSATNAAKTTNGQRYVVVTGTNVRLRLAPSTNAKILSSNGKPVYPAKGERIKYMGDAGDFHKVNYRGNYVYIHKSYATIQ